MNARIAITVFAVDDVDRSAAFWEAVFGWPRGADFPGIWVELIASPTHHLGLYSREGFAAQAGRVPAPVPPDGEATASELYVIVDDLDEAERRLRGAGAVVTSPRAVRPWGDESAYYADPDGNTVAVARPLPHHDA